MKCRDLFGSAVFWRLVRSMCQQFGAVFITTAVSATGLIDILTIRSILPYMCLNTSTLKENRSFAAFIFRECLLNMGCCLMLQ